MRPASTSTAPNSPPAGTGGDLDIAGDADAEGHRITGVPAPALFGSQCVVVGGPQHPFQRLRVVAHVVHRPDPRRVAVVERCDEVAAPDFGGVHPELGGEPVDHALDRDRRLGSPRTPVGRGGHGVGDDRDPAEAGVGDVVRTRRHQHRHRRQPGAENRVRAGVLHDVELVGRDAPVPSAAQPGVLDLTPAMDHGDHVLGARLGPTDRATGHLGVEPERRFVGEGARLCAEPAAHIGDDHPDARRVQPVDGRQHVAGGMGALAGRVVHEAAVVGPVRSRRAGFDGRSGQALVDDPLLDHDLGAAEVRPRARREPLHHVRADVRKQQLLVTQRRLRIDDHGERLVIDHHQVGSVAPARSVLGHDCDDRLTHEPHHATSDERSAHALGEGGAGGRGHAELGEVVPRKDGEDTGCGLGSGHVDAGDPCVRHRRPDVGQPSRVREHHIFDVRSAHGQEPGILQPRHPGAQDAAQPLLPSCRCGGRRPRPYGLDGPVSECQGT